METIAITVDQATLKSLDRLVASGVSKNRSEAVRTAVGELMAATERASREHREGEIIRKHRGKLSRQARELVRSQAKSK